MPLPTVFQRAQPRPEVLAGDLPDSIFAADLWEVLTGRAHPDYRDAHRFITASHPTESLAFLLREVGARLAGVGGRIPVFRLETGFGGGKTHGLIAAVHLAHEGTNLADALQGYGVVDLPQPGETSVAAFVGEQSDPIAGIVHHEDNRSIRTYTPWGEIAFQIGGMAGYELVRANDEYGGAPSRQALETLFGHRPVLILLDELVLYLARCLALPESHPRHAVADQMPTFLQTLFSLAAGRSRTAVVFTLPSEQDANRRITAALKQHLADVLDTIGEQEQTANRQAHNLTPTRPAERAAVIGKRLFQRIDRGVAPTIALAFVEYYEQQRAAGVGIAREAFEPAYREQIERSYPFHPALISLFAERLAAIPEFQSTRGALRLVARTVRSAWNNQERHPDALLLQPYHIDLTRREIRDELLARLGRGAFGQALDADVVKAGETTHASIVEQGWPVRAATEASIVVFLHSLPDGSRGLTPEEVALAVGRPGYDLAYVKRGLADAEPRAWYMRQEGDRFVFRTRASINKRFQEKLVRVGPGEVRQQLDGWIRDIYSRFEAFQVVLFPPDYTAIPDSPDRVRLAVIHYDKEASAVSGGAQLSFTRDLFTRTGAVGSPRIYRNNLVFLLAETTRVQPLKDAVRAAIAWERVRVDLEEEQARLAEARGWDARTYREVLRQGKPGVPPEFLALQNDVEAVMEKIGAQEVSVRTRTLEAYRVLAFPLGAETGQYDLFSLPGENGPLLECFRVDFGESPQPTGRRSPRARDAVAQAPILECLRTNGKLVPEPAPERNVVLAPQVVRQRPLWQPSERRLSTADVWDRLRRNPELPMVLFGTDLLPTFRAGLQTEPDPLWLYYDQAEKRVFTRATAVDLTPTLAPSHCLYDPRAAAEDRILPVAAITAAEIWDYLWPRDGVEHAPSAAPGRLLAAARTSEHYPVVPEPAVLWAGLHEGVRDRRWVLRFPGTPAIGADEPDEWPAPPVIDETTEIWHYQAAIERGLYPRQRRIYEPPPEELTPELLKSRCWPAGAEQVATEEIERSARSWWPALTRSEMEGLLRDGARRGIWGFWRQVPPQTFYLHPDVLPEGALVGPSKSLVEPESDLARRLDPLRPGRGPKPIEEIGTPREALTRAWERLCEIADVRVAELALTVLDRPSLENTLAATWADRPAGALPHASLVAAGQRLIDDKTETVRLKFEGRFEEVRALLAPVWPFKAQGQLHAAVTARFHFDPPVVPDDPALTTYRTALTNANQGSLDVVVTPARAAVEVG